MEVIILMRKTLMLNLPASAQWVLQVALRLSLRRSASATQVSCVCDLALCQTHLPCQPWFYSTSSFHNYGINPENISVVSTHTPKNVTSEQFTVKMAKCLFSKDCTEQVFCIISKLVWYSLFGNQIVVVMYTLSVMVTFLQQLFASEEHHFFLHTRCRHK